MDTGAIILSGGQGSRLGYREKGLMPFGGESLVERKVRQVAKRFPQTVIVTNRSHLYRSLMPGIRVVVDEKPYMGPLSGLYCGLRASCCETNFVCAVDMPFVSDSLLGHFESRMAGRDIVIGRIGGYAEPLFGFYSKRVLPLISRAISNPRAGIVSIAEEANTEFICEEEIRACDPELLSFENINTDEDLARCLAMGVDG